MTSLRLIPAENAVTCHSIATNCYLSTDHCKFISRLMISDTQKISTYVLVPESFIPWKGPLNQILHNSCLLGRKANNKPACGKSH